ncbi:flavodoxin domain-containing protein [Streptomyces indicus]|uniref:Menaquinone-dependent protoporphyrinogen oxidase n=1 Tax=Streptomyces indicus TaxID=417292 RepID=A0A1G8ZY59_9ACTN|nr:flavodoxin domain-containing protein [Streptomyces indicus]SDK19060.1 menaquinone-dependent protoporphyrinogen oxidase [Streptomyces indicus]
MSGSTVLVAYGSTYGATAEIASRIGVVLAEHGLTTEVCPAGRVRAVTAYDGVILGGALYAGRWHRDARRFAGRHRKALGRMPLWLFSSGPLDDSAPTMAPAPGVRRLLHRLDARDHITFGGRLDTTAGGRMARMLVGSGKGGDFRDFEAVTVWAESVARELSENVRA